LIKLKREKNETRVIASAMNMPKETLTLI